MDNMNNRQKFQHFFENLNKEKMHLVEEFYHPELEFHDPIGTLKGVKKMRRYYERMYKSVTSIKFEFSNFVESGNDIVGVWKMTLVTPNLNGGEPVVVDGNSVIKFKDGKAIYHRDYFDMGVFIYENIPVLGFVIKNIKNRFKVEEE
jgi:ketosteroid isomerase-like protein